MDNIKTIMKDINSNKMKLLRSPLGLSQERVMGDIIKLGLIRNDNFVIDEYNRPAYLALIDWIIGANILTDCTKGICIAGGTGSGKSVAMDILVDVATKYDIFFLDPFTSRPLFPKRLYMRNCQYMTGSGMGLQFSTNGQIPSEEFPIIFIDDVGTESTEAVYMGNRIDIVRRVIESRGDKHDKITLMTTNLNKEMFAQRYGHRAASRFNLMFNYIVMAGIDRRQIK